MRGMVLEVQRFSTGDGPGIRTTVFMKGCPLTCAWCHNPESQRRQPEMRFSRTACVLCGACMAVCPRGLHEVTGTEHRYRREGCTMCQKCVDACPVAALFMSGREIEVKELVALALRDRSYYAQRGGVTFSGGEPAMQRLFVKEAAQCLQQMGINTALDTCGYCEQAVLAALLPHFDLVLYDIKHMDTAKHEAGTGVGNEQILCNYQFIQRTGKPIIVRVPLISGYNDTTENLAAMLSLFREFPPHALELLPYHSYGKTKYRELGRKYPLEDAKAPCNEEMDAHRDYFRVHGICVI